MNPNLTPSPAEKESRLEAHANKLLMQSLKAQGYGEYPFFTTGYLRRLGDMDEGLLKEDDASHPQAPTVTRSRIWRLARKARLDSLQMDVLRLVLDDKPLCAIAKTLGISTRRGARLYHDAIDQMRQQLARVEATFREQVAEVLYEEETRRPPHEEKHCKPGHEECRLTHVCPRRWYLRDCD
ncbi:hypothetical protein LLH03_17865 [bacterium]|nr:hypothetical protein [bacterium]